ncbi:hypothetical protein CFO_g5605 [Ceratocystis platani]|uniref:Uncharacterized protein n=1 Tax=Ceratocystis fimbriata f. sp. platani TaxID=88771 RepID=A0A0F8BIQ2_CERFI|nr:hypothetical protein CFO_g5605 [Ceratocystis platani]
MAKGDTTVKKLTGHVSAEFRAMLKLPQGGQTTGKPNANVPKHVDAAKDTKAPNQKRGNKTDKGPMSYAAITSQGDKGTKKTVELKSKTTTKTATKEKKQMVRVFIRGPTAADEGTAGEEVAKAVGSKPSEILMKKVNSGWALLHPPKTTATDKKLGQIREACGAKVCELEKKWTHARITNLADFYVLSDNGPVTQKKEEWFAKQIEKQTGGHVKSIKWQVETEKFKDATLRIALELPEGQPLPKTLTFDGSANSATVKRCRTISTPLCRQCWKAHPTASCKEKPRCRLCGSTEHTEGDHKGAHAECVVCRTPGHSAGEPVCKRGGPPRPVTQDLTEKASRGSDHVRTERRNILTSAVTAREKDG